MKEINYFSDHIECTGCKRKFCHTVREHDIQLIMIFPKLDERWCMSCYSNRNGFEATLEIIRVLEQGPFEHNVMLWEKPVNELPKEIYDSIPFVRKGIKQNE